MEQQLEQEDVPLIAAVGLVYNLKKEGGTGPAPDMQAEYDSMDTVNAIAGALEEHGVAVERMEADEHLPERLLARKPKIVFNIAEGRSGRAREAQVPALLNLLGIPFTGSDETTLCIALDKALTKRLLSTYHIKTPHYAVIEPGAALHAASLRYPVIVKPNAEGSSKGVSEACVADTPEQLRALVKKNHALYGEAVLAEEYIAGREFTVGILGNGKDARVFPPLEIAYKQNTQGNYTVYSYEVKKDFRRYIDWRCPADMTPALDSALRQTAKRVYEALGCRDFARMDFRVDADGKPYFIEINPLPGLAPGYSDFPALAEADGVPYDELVYGVLKAGASRCGVRL